MITSTHMAAIMNQMAMRRTGNTTNNGSDCDTRDEKRKWVGQFRLTSYSQSR